ncbi:MAG: BrnT family toxin [Syntrophales bacterium]
MSFTEAQTVFLDENALLIADPDHSQEEDRFILLGFSSKLRVLIVCYSEEGDVMRIISARKATGQKENSIKKGNQNEKRIRFFKSQKESVCKTT